MLVTSCTTEAGAGATGVYVALALFGLEPPVAFTITSTTTMTMTRPTAPQAIIAPEIRRPGATGAGPAPGRGRGVLPPWPPPPLAPAALPPLPLGVLPVTGRLAALLRSLALWPDGPPGLLAGLGLFPPATTFFWSGAIVP